MLEKRTKRYLILFCLLFFIVLSIRVFAVQNTMVGIPLLLVNASNDRVNTNHSVTVVVSNADDNCATVLFNETYANGIINGLGNITLGLSDVFNSTYNQDYYVCFWIDNNRMTGVWKTKLGQGMIEPNTINSTANYTVNAINSKFLSGWLNWNNLTNIPSLGNTTAEIWNVLLNNTFTFLSTFNTHVAVQHGNTTAQIFSTVDNSTFLKISNYYWGNSTAQIWSVIDNNTFMRAKESTGNTTAQIIVVLPRLGNLTSEIWSVLLNNTFTFLSTFNAHVAVQHGNTTAQIFSTVDNSTFLKISAYTPGGGSQDNTNIAFTNQTNVFTAVQNFTAGLITNLITAEPLGGYLSMPYTNIEGLTSVNTTTLKVNQIIVADNTYAGGIIQVDSPISFNGLPYFTTNVNPGGGANTIGEVEDRWSTGYFTTINFTNALGVSNIGVSAVGTNQLAGQSVNVNKLARISVNASALVRTQQNWTFYGNNANFTIANLSGTGNAYACVNSAGTFYRSSVACV